MACIARIKTPLEILADEGVSCRDLFIYPFRTKYDFDCYFAKDELPPTSTAKNIIHRSACPLCLLVCVLMSPDFESRVCFISESDPQNLVNRMENHLEFISTTAFQTLKETCLKDAHKHLEVLSDEKDAYRRTTI